MSYWFRISDQDFCIEAGKVGAAHNALLNLVREDPKAYVGYPYTEDRIGASLKQWEKSFERLIFDLGYSLDGDGNGNVDCIYLEHDKFHDEDEMFFEVIAPFVKEGSFVQFTGEDNYMWRYTFKNGKCIEQRPIIKWVDQQ